MMPPEEPLPEVPEPAAFLTKTYEMVDDPALDDVISWTEDGSAFVVRETAEFARDLLPSKFKHSNFTSFLRQLYAYVVPRFPAPFPLEIMKISSDRWEFANELFRRGEKPLLNDVRRRRNSSSAEECGFSSMELVEENRRLRSENVELKRELRQVKKVIGGVAALMYTYTSGHQPAPEEDEEEEEASTRLFGVQISVRGTKEKSKPSDRGSNLEAD